MRARLRRVLPAKQAHQLSRWRNMAYAMYAYQLARRKPGLVKAAIQKQVRAFLG